MSVDHVECSTPVRAHGRLPGRAPILVLACGALARELRFLPTALGVTVRYLPAALHNRPAAITAALDAALDAARADGLYAADAPTEIASAPTPTTTLMVAYADCGTAGAIDRWCEEHQAARLPGAHCYELFAGADRFAELMDDEPGTFFLTDYLALHFEALVLDGLGISSHPELAPLYFGNYRLIVHLAQSGDLAVASAARRAAEALGLELRTIPTGREPLLSHVISASETSTIGGGR